MSQSLSFSDKVSQITQSSQPIPLLEQITQTQKSGYINAHSTGINWVFIVNRGHLIYASHSIDPWDRIQRHLRRLGHINSKLTREICAQLRLTVEKSQSSTDQPTPPEYLAINWLVEQKYLPFEQAQLLVERMTDEVLESYLLTSQIQSYQFVSSNFLAPIFKSSKLSENFGKCQQRLQSWSTYLPAVWSPFQRPYFFTNRFSEEKLSLAQRQKLSQTLKGFSLRHLSALLNIDELVLIQRLSPLIRQKAIILREPSSPFDRLPQFSKEIASQFSVPEVSEEAEINFSPFGDQGDQAIRSKAWKIVCIDDSPTILKEIERYLDNKNLEVIMISDSLKALMQILRIKPDLILMDVNMPNVDGYKLCSMLRKSPLLQSTPIIMVTGKAGLIDRTKAKMMGATDYMTKPFTQGELLQLVFRYLT
jgi:chemotaxis family two-component system response regulator PixG